MFFGKTMLMNKNREHAMSEKTTKENKNSLTPEEKGVYLFMDEVTSESCKELITFILCKSFQRPRPKCLQVIINSPGGDLNAAFAVTDIMAGCPIPVHTVGIGQIASAGFMMFIAGHKGQRILTPNTSIMSHQWSWGSWGKEHELIAVSKEHDLTSIRMINHYKKCTGMTEKNIRKYLLPPTDVFLSAKEAVKLKCADKIKAFK